MGEGNPPAAAPTPAPAGGAVKGAPTPKGPPDHNKMMSDLKNKLLHMRKGLIGLRQELRGRAALWDAALEEIDTLEEMAAEAKISLAKQEEDARAARKARERAAKNGGAEKEQDEKKEEKEEKKEEKKNGENGEKENTNEEKKDEN